MDLHIEKRFAGLDHTPALDEAIDKALERTIARFSDRLTRVEVHCKDENSPHKSGANDKRCLMEARPRGMDPVVAEESGNDMKLVIREAARTLERVLEKRLKKD